MIKSVKIGISYVKMYTTVCCFMTGRELSTCVLVLSIFNYTYDNTCTLLKYFLIPAGVACTYTQVPNVSA